MAYWDNQSQNAGNADSYGTNRSSGGSGEFYELEPAVVLDIILDKDHALFKNADKTNLQTTIDVERWPADYQGNKPQVGEVDYSWIGRALVRMQYSSPTTQKEHLVWAYPIDSAVSEYPLINEVVILMKYRNKYYYSRRVNTRNLPNEAVDFSINPTISGQENTELFSNALWAGRQSKTNFEGKIGAKGAAGRYLKLNDRVRRIRRYEGDTVIESRFGQSIRIGSYDDNRANDKGDPVNVDYADYGGNPMLIIRNRQRKLLKEGDTLSLGNSPNPATITGTKEEKNAGGYIQENINHDGSSIYITSGQTISKWVTTCYKKMFGTGEEVSAFTGKSSFKYPVLNGDQLVLNTDRIVLASRHGETFHYSKKRYAVVTDDEYTVDAHNQMVFTTNTKTVFNSPAIYLGEYDKTDEPILLGQTAVNWLYELCNWLEAHIHKHEHSHVDAGDPSPKTTQTPVDPQIAKLRALRDILNTLLSRRVFTTGGGFAPGHNGGNITNGSTPVSINVVSGQGVPGGWKGANKR